MGAEQLTLPDTALFTLCPETQKPANPHLLSEVVEELDRTIPIITMHLDKSHKRVACGNELGLINDDTVVAALDFGGLINAKCLADCLDVLLVFAEKYRPEPNFVEVKGVYLIHEDGRVEKLDNDFLEGKTVLEPDDMIDTGGTAIDCTAAIKRCGAKTAVLLATHAIFSPLEPKPGSKTLHEAIQDGTLDKVVVTNSLPFCHRVPGIEIVSIAKPTASLIRIVAGIADDQDIQRVRRCLFPPDQIKGN